MEKIQRSSPATQAAASVRLSRDELEAARAYVEREGMAEASSTALLNVATLRKVLAGVEPVSRGTAELVRARLVRGGARI